MESNSAFASQMKKERENGGRQPFSLFFGAAGGFNPEGHKLRTPPLLKKGTLSRAFF
ncbi:MAG: hypothetical protein J6J83_07720 [Oscillospiraceae bacterium]|nr:hypothetical protein [Oscillospiraceae bacterium]